MGCTLAGLPVVRSCAEQEGAFPNAAAPTAQPWDRRLVLVGDPGTSHEGRNQAVSRALEQYFLQAESIPTDVLLLGDNFYPRGLVGRTGTCGESNSAESRAEIERQIEEVLGPYDWLRERGIKVHAIAGNHDHGCGAEGLANQRDIDQFLAPSRRWGAQWQFYAGPPREILLEELVQVVTLDSHRMIFEDEFLRESAARLRTLLAAGTHRYAWQLVAAHHPLLTAGPHDGAWPQGLRRPASFLLFPAHFLAALNLPPFADLNQDAYAFRYRRYRQRVLEAIWESGAPVPLVLSGHDHNLQLLSAHDAGTPLQLVSGSGAYCSPVQWRHDLLFAAPQNGFAVLSVRNNALLIEFYTVVPCAGAPPCAMVTTPSPHRAFHTLLSHERSVGRQDADRILPANDPVWR